MAPVPRVLAMAIAEQEQRACADAIPAALACADAARVAETKRRSYAMGARVLAYCADHPRACDGAEAIVQALRQAMARGEFIADRLADVWCHVPGAADVLVGV